MATEILWRHNADPKEKYNTLLLLACAGPSILKLKHILEHCSEVTMHNVVNIGHGKCSNMVKKIFKKKLREHAQNCDVPFSPMSHIAPVFPTLHAAMM
jgi:hypothetical protein